MITACTLLKTALERKSAFLVPAALGAGVGGIVGASRPDRVKKKGHGAGRAALTGLATGTGLGLGALAGGIGTRALATQPILDGKPPDTGTALLAAGLPLAGAAAGGLLGYHISKDDEVDDLLAKEKKHNEDD